MLDRSGILDKDLIKLANQAEKMLKKKKDFARNAINNLPESEAKMKAKLSGLLKSTTSKNADPEDLIKELKKIVSER